MRGEDRAGERVMRVGVLLLLALLLPATGGAQTMSDVPRLSGNTPPTEPVKAAQVPATVANDVRQMRNYPEQPPLIPHSIEGYQLTLNTNRCLSCHSRQFVQASGAPMISVTHFMDRDGQVLADVTPRRYFCTACHVSQSDTPPLVMNTFRDPLSVGGR